MFQKEVYSHQLYTVYTNDLTPAGHRYLDSTNADDVTQIMTTQSKLKFMIKRKVEREIDKISKNELRWKKRTSKEKFKIISLAQYKIKLYIFIKRQKHKNS